MLSLPCLSKDQWSLCSGNTNICDFKAFLLFFFLSRHTGLPLYLNILLNWGSPDYFFLHENIHLLGCEKQPIYEACNWKPSLNIGPSEVQLSKHKAVWKLLWIYLKMLLYEKVMKPAFLWFPVFSVAVKPASQENLISWCFHFWPQVAEENATPVKAQIQNCTRTYKIIQSSFWICCWNIYFHA